MSLASGLTFGGLLAYGAVRMSADPKNFLFPFGESLKCFNQSTRHKGLCLFDHCGTVKKSNIHKRL